MEIKLKKLDLENFKGVGKFSMKPEGKSCLVQGDNGAGKTTLLDAFLWLLFDKDSRGNSQFSIKTLTKEGKTLHNLEHSVSLVLDIDGKDLSLKKALKEKYTKKRGSRVSEFTGNTTSYYIDSVPVQKKEWDKRISEIIDEETFKLLTSSTYFNSLHWEKRRGILLDVCGDISDADVIASDKGLADLPEILGNKSLEDQKKIIAATRKTINDRLKEIPARIDELNKSLADVSAVDIKACELRIIQLGKKIEAMKDDTVRSNLRKDKAKLEADLAEMIAEKGRAHREANKEVDDQIDDLGRSQRDLNNKAIELASKMNSANQQINANKVDMGILRDKYQEINEEDANVKDCCPTCNQALPEEEVEAAITKFNEQKATRLADINTKGKALKATNKELAEENAANGKEKEKLEADVKAIDEEIEALEGKQTKEPGDTPAIVKIKAKIEDVKDTLNANITPDTSGLESDRRAEQAKIAEVKATEKTKTRIKELAQEEKRLAEEYEELEKQMFLMEKFIVRKVGLLEATINDRFDLARFKLFKEQINEGIKETCITLYDGVPFGDSLNTGAEINVGLDIVKTLSEHYGIHAPVWIDHSESVTEILDPGTQTIKLEVSEDHPELEVSYG